MTCASVWISLRTPFFQHRFHIVGGGCKHCSRLWDGSSAFPSLPSPLPKSIHPSLEHPLLSHSLSLLSCVSCSTTLLISPSSHFTTISYSASKLFSCTPIKNMLDLLDYQSFTHQTNVCIINKFCAYPSYSKTVQGPLRDTSLNTGTAGVTPGRMCV